MTPLPPDFKEFLALMNSRTVRYLLIGGYAVGHYGYPRNTGDIDLWIDIDPPGGDQPDNAEKIAAVLAEFGFDVPGLSADLFREPGRVIRMGVPPFRIELLTTISGVTFGECHAARVDAVLDGVPVPLIGLEHLKANKRASGRPKDLADLAELP